MADTDRPNRQSSVEQAEGDKPSTAQSNEQGKTGITNRPLDEENDSQERVPDRGDAKPGAHAG
jgi:hypothetical protein